MASISYAPLGSQGREIRLLTLLPSTEAPHDSSVHCTLKPISFDETPSYIALSYTWGPKEPTATIVVNNQLVRVRQNLKDALQNIQSESKPIAIWVDALCVDQKNDEEKTHQVQMMCEIYTQAREVFAWIGPANNDSDEAMERVEEIGQKAIKAGIGELRPTDIENWFTPTTDPRLSRRRVGIEELVEEEGLVAALVVCCPRLYEREYWSRVWVAQEISVARRATSDLYAFPRSRFPWRYRSLGFRDPVFGPHMKPITLKTMQLRSNTVSRRVIGIRSEYKKKPESLQKLLKRTCYNWLDAFPLKSTDPRDKIYGILNLASDAVKLDIQLDYALTVVQVYCSVTRAFIHDGQTTALAWSRQIERMNGLPSWVPDFSTPIREPSGEDTSSGPLFQASGKYDYSKTVVCSCQIENILGLSGTRVDRIAQLGSVHEPHFNMTFSRTAAQRFLNEIKNFCTASQLYNTQAKVEDAKMRIPCADQEYYFGTSRTRVSSLSSLREDYESLYLPGPIVAEDLDGPGWKHKFSMAYQYDRKPFLSAEGHVGLAPSTSIPGDLICIIFGASIPFILRPVANKRFELIGEAYVYGVMDGEWFDKSRLVETFHLC